MGRPPTRICSRGHDKDITGRRPDGNCVECSRHYCRMHRAKNLERQRTYDREWKRANPQPPRPAYAREYRRTHKEHRRQLNARWRKRNRARLNEYAYARRRKCSSLSSEKIEAVLNYYGTACVYCGAPSTGFDHLYPLSKEGEHLPENLAPCCKPCNSKKGNRPIWTMLS